jgi:SP family xylose:H+ symportor-like MFS transporter
MNTTPLERALPAQARPSGVLPDNRGSLLYTTLLSLVAALGGLLFGYDTAVISGAIGFMQAHFQLSAIQTGWAASCTLLGCVLGAGFAGVLSDSLGRKKVLTLSAILFLVSAVGTALPRNLTEFALFRIICGLAVGAASITSPMYIAEISPSRIRGRMVSVNQLAIVSGMLMVYFVNYFIARQGDTAWNQATGWRWMFGSEAVPALVLLGLLFLVPETPRFLVAKDRPGEALKILQRVNGADAGQKEMSEISEAIARESASLAELLRSGVRVVLLIGVALAVLQQVTGINVFLYYAPEIFKKLGTGSDAALLQTIVVGAVNLLFTIVAIWSVDLWGRKPLMILGSLGMGLCLVSMGVAAWHQSTQLWVLLFILGYIASFALAVGPVTWVILSEIFPTRIRGRALAVATVCLWTANFIVSQTFPMMDSNTWLLERFHHGFPFFVYAAFCAVTLVLVWRWVPETKGKSLEAIEKSWAGPAVGRGRV